MISSLTKLRFWSTGIENCTHHPVVAYFWKSKRETTGLESDVSQIPKRYFLITLASKYHKMADSLFGNEKKEAKEHFRDYCSNYNSIDAVITKVRDYFSYGMCIKPICPGKTLSAGASSSLSPNAWVNEKKEKKKKTNWKLKPTLGLCSLMPE